jgi:hypothetical protein
MKKETISHASNKFVFMILKPIPRDGENFRLRQCWQIRIDCPNNLSRSWGMMALKMLNEPHHGVGFAFPMTHNQHISGWGDCRRNLL